MFTAEQLEMLQAPLQEDVIKERRGGGNRMLKYIKGDGAIKAGNRIFGYGQWGYRVVSRGHMVVNDPKRGGPVDMYTADVELWVKGAEFTFPGAGCGIVTEPFTAEMHEKAYKEAETDGMKRALRHYGDQFGLCLYDEDSDVMLSDGTIDQVKNVRPANSKPATNKPAQKQAQQTNNKQPATKSPEPAQIKQQSKDPMTPGQLMKALQSAELIDEVTGRVIDLNLLVEITGRKFASAGKRFDVAAVKSLGGELSPKICHILELMLHELKAAKKVKEQAPEAA